MASLVGSSIVALKYAGGVLVGADTCLSYGSSKRFDNVVRIAKVTDKTVIGYAGDEADFSYALKELVALSTDARCYGNPIPSPSEIHGFLSTRNFSARVDMQPIYNSYVTAGISEEGDSYIGFTDIFGTSFEANFFSSGIGKHYCMPILRRMWTPELSFDQAVDILNECLKVLWYNDASAGNKVVVVKVDNTGTSISSPVKLQEDWSIARHFDPDLVL